MKRVFLFCAILLVVTLACQFSTSSIPALSDGSDVKSAGQAVLALSTQQANYLQKTAQFLEKKATQLAESAQSTSEALDERATAQARQYQNPAEVIYPPVEEQGNQPTPPATVHAPYYPPATNYNSQIPTPYTYNYSGFSGKWVGDPIFSTTQVFCAQYPQEIRLSVPADSVDRGMAVYYRLQEKATSRQTDWQKKDLYQHNDGIRSATINGSNHKDIFFPHSWGESWLKMQIVTDNGDYRSRWYLDVTYIPCPY